MFACDLGYPEAAAPDDAYISCLQEHAQLIRANGRTAEGTFARQWQGNTIGWLGAESPGPVGVVSLLLPLCRLQAVR